MESIMKKETYTILGVKEDDLRNLLAIIKESPGKKTDYYQFINRVKDAAKPIQDSIDLLDTKG
jgi:uncharacterized protein YaaQ